MWSFWWSRSIHLFAKFSNIITSQSRLLIRDITSRGRCGAFGGVGQYTCLVGLSTSLQAKAGEDVELLVELVNTLVW